MKNQKHIKSGIVQFVILAKNESVVLGKKVKSDLIEKNNKEGMLSEDQVSPDNLDVGFKVFSLDSSNLTEWQANFDELETNIDLFEVTSLQNVPSWIFYLKLC